MKFKKMYLRKPDRTPYGVVVAVPTEYGINYGYSLCSPKDRFDKKLGTVIALRRSSEQEEDKFIAPKLKDREQEVLAAYMRISGKIND